MVDVGSKCCSIMSDTPDNVPFIKNFDLLLGIFMSYENTKSFLESAELLNENKKFQASIPMSTISIEECMKATEFCIRYRKNEDLSKEDWENLKNHKYKLVRTFERAIEIVSKASEEESEKTKQELKQQGFPIQDWNNAQFIENLKNKSFIYSHLQKLREKCFYIDWNVNLQRFESFAEISQLEQELIIFHIERSKKLIRISKV